jgi:DNA-binding CsgD family transcriptional regulator
MLFETRQAVNWLTKYFGHNGLLPAQLRDWLKRHVSSGLKNTKDMVLASPHFSIQRESKILTIHLLSPAKSTEHRLLLTESDQKLHAQPLQNLGVTKREAEVLLWICQGKRNCEIAAILGTSERTVGKHIEEILRKLCVETRTAAATKAFELLARSGTKQAQLSRCIFTQCADHRTLGPTTSLLQREPLRPNTSKRHLVRSSTYTHRSAAVSIVWSKKLKSRAWGSLVADPILSADGSYALLLALPENPKPLRGR